MYQSSIPCPKCGAPNLKGTWVCSRCGNTLIVYCPHCHAGNEAGSQVCRSCYAPLADYSSPPPPPQQAYYPQYPPPGFVPPQAPQQQQQYPGYQQPPYPDYQQPPYESYQQPPYPGYDQYQQYPAGGYDPYGGYPAQQPTDWIGKTQLFFDNLTVRLKRFVATTNPILLSVLVVLIVGMAVFTILAFQMGWIKTAAPAETAGPADTTPVLISVLTIKEGSSPHSAIISWVTNKYSSSQVKYGIWPYANNNTVIENDPRAGTNMGVLTHEVGLTNLLPKTAYVYQAISIDKHGNVGTSPEMRFDTTP